MLRTTTVLCGHSETHGGHTDIHAAGVTGVVLGPGAPTISLAVVVIVDFDGEDVGTTPVVGLDLWHTVSAADPLEPLVLHVEGHPTEADEGPGADQLIAIGDDFPAPLLALGGGRLVLRHELTDQPVPGPGFLVVGTGVNGSPSSRAVCELLGLA